MLYFNILGTGFTALLLYFMYTANNDEKELLFLGSLGAPIIMPIVTIVLWVIYLWT